MVCLKEILEDWMRISDGALRGVLLLLLLQKDDIFLT